jgi:hypothetical protein
MESYQSLNREEALELLNSATPGAVHEMYNTPYELLQNQIDTYRQDGSVKLKNVLIGDALVYARDVISAAVILRKEHDKRALAEKSQYEQSFLQCGYLCWDFPAVKDLVFGKRFAAIARDLLGGEGARLWHDQALFKEPSGRVTDVHIDSSYWPVAEPLKTTTLWLALNDVPRKKGSLFFYKGSHKFKQHEYVDIFKNPHLPEELAAHKEGVIHTDLQAGDATFHSGGADF